MLIAEFDEELILKFLQSSICVSWYSYSLSLISCRVDLDEVLQLVVIDIIYR